MITENRLDAWTRANKERAKGLIVDLVDRLLTQSCPQPRSKRFPKSDSIGQKGVDGVLDAKSAYDPFVPKGTSFWEISVGENAKEKAEENYSKLTSKVDDSIKKSASFIFVTPYSGSKGWPYTHSPDGQIAWLEEKKTLGQWGDVRVIDGTHLVDWAHKFPAVERWLLLMMGYPAKGGFKTAGEHWDEISHFGGQTILQPDIFLINRDAASEKLRELFNEETIEVALETHHPEQAADFVSAFVASLPEEERKAISGRLLIVSTTEDWHALSCIDEKLILVPGPELDISASPEYELITYAKNRGKSAVYARPPETFRSKVAVSLPDQREYQLEDALNKSGFPTERSRDLAHKSAGNLVSLRRLLSGRSIKPKWAEGSHAQALCIAQLAGGWSASLAADQKIIADLAGTPYPDFESILRLALNLPASPLSHNDRIWRFKNRYEGWRFLGNLVFDDTLEKFINAAVAVLSEDHPGFALPPEDRWAAEAFGKSLLHSNHLRNDIANTLALMGSQPEALTNCSSGTSAATAAEVVRKVLDGGGWIRWGSLNGLLPLLAEAAPSEFFSAVDSALDANPSPFTELFKQETGGTFGATYIAGLLWALEALAWDPDYLTRAVITLGRLAEIDPGGASGNRPFSSIRNILLPWLPCTVANTDLRTNAIKAILRELPGIGFRLLTSLINSNGFSTGAHRPVWRRVIPEDWTKGVTQRDYFEQVSILAAMAIEAASSDPRLLQPLIEKIEHLPKKEFDAFAKLLSSQAVTGLPEESRLTLWEEIEAVRIKYVKYAEAKWAMGKEAAEQLERVSNLLRPQKPSNLYRRFFTANDLELFEETDDWEAERETLKQKRMSAVRDILAEGGMDTLISFATGVSKSNVIGQLKTSQCWAFQNQPVNL